MRKMSWVLVAALVFGLAGCGGDEGQDPHAGGDDAAGADAASDAGDAAGPADVIDATDVAADDVGADVDDRPPKVCRAGATWSPGTLAFSDATADTTLPALGVTGVRVSAVDWDGDGDPDLVIRNHTEERDDFGDGGARYTWLLRNDGELQFTDVTRESGFSATPDGGEGRVTHAVIWGDVDNDGDLDAFSGVGVNPNPDNPDHGDRNEILLNQGDGTFALADAGALRLADERQALTAAAFTDFDRDGLLDVWAGIGSGFYMQAADRVFRGDGGGVYSDVSADVGVATWPWMSLANLNVGTSHHDSWGVTACDLNDDGLPDLLGSSYGRYWNALWINTPEGFKIWSVESGYGQDHRTDWSTNLNAQCFCKLYPDEDECDAVPDPPDYLTCEPGQQLRWDHTYDREPFRLGGNTFSTACGDLDNDGDLDLMTMEIVHWDVGDTSDPSELLYNDGEYAPTFDRPGNEATGLVRDWGRLDWNAGDMSGALFDFDGDGRLDVLIASSDYPGTRVFLFHQEADGTFKEVPVADGIDHARGHGVGVADYDGDGDLDVVIGHSRMRCEGDDTCLPSQEVHLFKNEIGQDNNWLRVRLVGGEGSNHAAIGARVRVTAGGVTQTHQIDGGHGHVGIQHDLVQTFGLGEVCDIDEIEIRWPDAAGTVERWTDVRANYEVTLTQGSGEVAYRL